MIISWDKSLYSQTTTTVAQGSIIKMMMRNPGFECYFLTACTNKIRSKTSLSSEDPHDFHSFSFLLHSKPNSVSRLVCAAKVSQYQGLSKETTPRDQTWYSSSGWSDFKSRSCHFINIGSVLFLHLWHAQRKTHLSAKRYLDMIYLFHTGRLCHSEGKPCSRLWGFDRLYAWNLAPANFLNI